MNPREQHLVLSHECGNIPGEIPGRLLVSYCAFCVCRLFLATRATAQSPVPNTPQGFQQQYHPAFEAYERHDTTGLEKRLDTFTIPAPWFSQTFGTDRGPGLARRYASEFLDFKQRTASNFAGIDSLKARLQLDPSTPTDVWTRPWTAAENTSTLQGMPALCSAASRREVRNGLRPRRPGPVRPAHFLDRSLCLH